MGPAASFLVKKAVEIYIFEIVLDGNRFVCPFRFHSLECTHTLPSVFPAAVAQKYGFASRLGGLRTPAFQRPSDQGTWRGIYLEKRAKKRQYKNSFFVCFCLRVAPTSIHTIQRPYDTDLK